MKQLPLLLVFFVIIASGCIKESGIDDNGLEIEDSVLSGNIKESQTWSGKINVTGDVLIERGVSVTILPGTIISISANSDSQNSGGMHIIDEATEDDPSVLPEYTRTHTSITVIGSLIAEGKPDMPITFTSDSETPSHTDWDGLKFENNSTGILKYVIYEWAHTGPAIHDSENVNITHSTIRHIFWGGLHAFRCSPIFEYNTIDDIGHEAFDTHKASPVIRFNKISHSRTGFVFNNHAGKPIIFENNVVKDCGATAQLQENPWAIIRNNEFIGSNDTGGPWEYKGFFLYSESPSSGIGLADNVNVEITNNTFKKFRAPPIFYDNIGPNMGIGHTTSMPEPFVVGDGPISIDVLENKFCECGEINTTNPETGEEWGNFNIGNDNVFEDIC